MKRLVAAVVLLIFAVAVSVFGHVLLIKNCDKMIAQLASFNQLAEEENFDELEAKAEAFTKEWSNKYHKIFSILVGHGRLDNIQRNIPLLQKSAELEDKEEFLYSCLECISILDDLKMNERVSISNVLTISPPIYA